MRPQRAPLVLGPGSWAVRAGSVGPNSNSRILYSTWTSLQIAIGQQQEPVRRGVSSNPLWASAVIHPPWVLSNCSSRNGRGHSSSVRAGCSHWKLLLRVGGEREGRARLTPQRSPGPVHRPVPSPSILTRKSPSHDIRFPNETSEATARGLLSSGARATLLIALGYHWVYPVTSHSTSAFLGERIRRRRKGKRKKNRREPGTIDPEPATW